jgi:Cdc6-like AAA superfamily ATPase
MLIIYEEKDMQYLICIEGLGQEVWQEARSEKEALKLVWNSLTDEERNLVVLMDCIDEQP